MVALRLAFMLWSSALGLGLAVPKFALANSNIQLYPVELEGYTDNDGIKVTFLRPCGGKLEGFLLYENEPDTLAIAAVIGLKKVTCISLGRPMTMVIDHVNVSGYKTIKPFNTKLAGRSIKLIVTSRIELLAEGTATIAYESSCRPTAGLVLGVDRKQQTYTARIVELGKPSRRRACHHSPKLLHTKALRLPSGVGLASTNHQNLIHQPRLQLAPIDLNHLERVGQEITQVRFKSRCNEAPVGLVISAPQRKPAANVSTAVTSEGVTTVGLGMLTVRYSKYPCVNKNDAYWQTFVTRGLRFGPNVTLKHLRFPKSSLRKMGGRRSLNQGGLLSVIKPIGIRRPETTLPLDEALTRTSLNPTLQYRKTCNKHLGTIYGFDQEGHLSLGVLQYKRHPSRVGRCKSPPLSSAAIGDLSLPFLTDRVLGQKIYPMSLRI